MSAYARMHVFRDKERDREIEMMAETLQYIVNKFTLNKLSIQHIRISEPCSRGQGYFNESLFLPLLVFKEKYALQLT